MTEFPISALRSVDLEVPDLAAAEQFYTQAWGLDLAARGDDAIYLRGTGADHHILALHSGPAPAMRSITFRAGSVGALHAAASRTADQGGRVLHPVGPVDWMAGGTGLVLADNQGRTLRLVHGDATRTPGPPIRDRATRLSHVNINSTDTDAARAWYEAVLGFQMTDRSKMMAFVRCNSDHHCIVIADAPVNGLNHVAFMLPGHRGRDSAPRAAWWTTAFPSAGASAVTGPATTCSPTSSIRSASWWNTPPRCCRWTTPTASAAPATGPGPPAAPTNGASPPPRVMP